MSPPRKIVGVEQAEHEIGIGHGRCGAAAAVTGGAGRRAGAVGTDFKQAEIVDRAMLPPPAPISIMSIEGMATGMPLPSLKRQRRSTSKVR